MAQKSIDPLLAIPLDRLQWMEDMLARHNTIDAKKDVKAFVDDSLRRDAMKIRKP